MPAFSSISGDHLSHNHNEHDSPKAAKQHYKTAWQFLVQAAALRNPLKFARKKQQIRLVLLDVHLQHLEQLQLWRFQTLLLKDP